jgi:hypothetical protein
MIRVRLGICEFQFMEEATANDNVQRERDNDTVIGCTVGSNRTRARG